MVILHSHDFFGPLQEFHGQVASTWTYFKHYICAFDTSFVYNRLNNQWVFQDVLALALVELDACGDASL